MPAADRLPRVLFLCTHNSARSQMAEALLRSRSRGRVEVESAGTEKTLVRPLALKSIMDRLLAARAVARIREAFGRDLALRAFFEDRRAGRTGMHALDLAKRPRPPHRPEVPGDDPRAN